jgi:general secretion pathway protein C
MEPLLRRQSWIVELGVVAVCSLLAAGAVATALETWLVPERVVATIVTRAARAAAAAAPRAKEIQAIVERDIFCSACRGATPGPAPAARGPTATALPLRLVAIMYAPPPWHERWSLAIIHDDETRGARPYALGMTVRGARIDAIEAARVYLARGGDRREYLDLGEGVPMRVAVPAFEGTGGIVRTGEHSYELRRAAVDELLAGGGAPASLARVAPEVRDGRVVSFRLVRLRPDSLLARGGLQDGDVVVAINGLEIDGVERALEVYTRLRTASHLSVAVERAGRRITLEYRIR